MKTGLLIISHGSRDTSWTALVDEAIAQADWPDHVPVASSFLECVPGRDIQDGIHALEAQGVERIAVIPLFVSEGSTHVDEIAWALGVKAEPLIETDLELFQVKAELIYGSPLGEHEALYEMLAHQLRELQVDGQRDAVMLVAHGSPHEPFQTRWKESLERMAERLTSRGFCLRAHYSLLCCDDIAARTLQLAQEVQASSSHFTYLHEQDRNIHIEHVNDSELVLHGEDQASAAFECRVAVIPLFLSRGYFTTHVIPNRLQGLLDKSRRLTHDPHEKAAGEASSADEGMEKAYVAEKASVNAAALLSTDSDQEREGVDAELSSNEETGGKMQGTASKTTLSVLVSYDGTPLLPHAALTTWLEQEARRLLSAWH